MEHVLLAAASLSIGTHIINAPLETQKDRGKLRKMFSIPDSYEPMCLIRAGYYSNPPGNSVRLVPAQFVHRERFGGGD